MAQSSEKKGSIRYQASGKADGYSDELFWMMENFAQSIVSIL